MYAAQQKKRLSTPELDHHIERPIPVKSVKAQILRLTCGRSLKSRKGRVKKRDIGKLCLETLERSLILKIGNDSLTSGRDVQSFYSDLRRATNVVPAPVDDARDQKRMVLLPEIVGENGFRRIHFPYVPR
ncbi:hypothetical protein TNCV_2099131 [Trichonephila clavipes]|nr:hypothetical protein TNCV_2099131 [Trichonephila clavipes]